MPTRLKITISLLAIIGYIFLFQSFSFAQSPPIFGPIKYLRTTGPPNTYTNFFQACNTSATYKLVVENGEAGKERVSSASVSLNGIEIVSENEFNQSIDKIEKAITPKKENTLSIRLAGGPGGFIKIGIYCVSGCLDVKITSPATGATVNRSHVIVQGNLYNATGEVGIILHSSGVEGQVSSLAQLHGSSFAGIIPLQTGQNIITLQATDSCGYQVKDSITISSAITQETIRLIAIPNSGIADLVVGLKADLSISNPVTNYHWDLDGDGIIDLIGNYPEVTNTYQVPGLYFPRVIVIDNQGIAYEETAIINVLSRDEMDILLKAKWEGMRGKLMSGDVEGAVGYIASRSKNMYRYNFELMSSILPTIAQDMGNITLINIAGNIAEYELILVQDGKAYSFYVEFMRDEDGIWRIRFY